MAVTNSMNTPRSLHSILRERVDNPRPAPTRWNSGFEQYAGRARIAPIPEPEPRYSIIPNANATADTVVETTTSGPMQHSQAMIDYFNQAISRDTRLANTTRRSALSDWSRALNEDTTLESGYFNFDNVRNPAAEVTLPIMNPPPLESIRTGYVRTESTAETIRNRINNTILDTPRVGSLASLGSTGNLTTSGTLNTSGSRFSVNADGDVRYDPAENTSAAWGTVTGSTTVGAGKTNPYLNMSEQSFVEFIKNKLNLSVALTQAGKGFEIKVSLSMAESGEELISDSDYVEIEG